MVVVIGRRQVGDESGDSFLDRDNSGTWAALGCPFLENPMANHMRRFVRVVVLILIGTSLSACHFCGHGYGGWQCDSWVSHCHVHARHCR